MTTVYYNFPEITLSMAGTDCSKKITLPRIGQPTTNIQLNNINYSACAIYITAKNASKKGTIPEFFIVECWEDIQDEKSNKIYVVFPLVVDTPT